LDNNRYKEFEYVRYLDLEDHYVDNFVKFHLNTKEPVFDNRLASHVGFWRSIGTPEWLADVIENGLKIPFERKPPRMLLQNSNQVLKAEIVDTVRGIPVLNEYLAWGFIEKVAEIPYCVLPLQLKETVAKTALIYDMSPLNVYVEKSKFKLEGWEEMLDFSVNANCAIKFDIKKFYHRLSIHPAERKYFGFMYQLEKDGEPEMFVWKTMPYGYTRAPFLARNLMKPLVALWRSIGLNIVVFYDDGMAVHSDFNTLKYLATMVHVDLIKAGLIPGINKCIWSPVPVVDWNGLRFDLTHKKLSVMEHRITETLRTAVEL
jgi:hypothetical protein